MDVRAWRVCRLHTPIALSVGVVIAVLAASVTVSRTTASLRGGRRRRRSASAVGTPAEPRFAGRDSQDGGIRRHRRLQYPLRAGRRRWRTPLQSDFDPIGETLTQAHAAGLRVHAWIDVTFATPPDEFPSARDHVIYQHPEWLMVPRAIAAELLAVDNHGPDYIGRLARWTRLNTSRVDGLYISPLQPDAATHIAETVRGLVRQACDRRCLPRSRAVPRR